MGINSTIIVNDASLVDFAYIDNHGQLKGGSFNYSFAISGETTPNEKVIVDFSTIKKKIKSYLDLSDSDNKMNGFDHKLWIIQGYSTCNLIKMNKGYFIETPVLSLKLPFDAVKSVACLDIQNTNEIEGMLTRDLQYKLGQKVNLKSFVDFSFRSKFSSPTLAFSYVHGLKDSTSYGCQNIAHGHRSYLQLLSDKDNDIVKTVRKQIVTDLQDAILINKENIVDEDHNLLKIKYTTVRGDFELSLKKEENKFIVFDTETTIEYIGQYIKEMYFDELKDANVYAFVVSEGLNKGAYVEL